MDKKKTKKKKLLTFLSQIQQIFYLFPLDDDDSSFKSMSHQNDDGMIKKGSVEYSEPSLQWQHLFPKILPLKRICCGKDSLMDRLIYKKDLVFFLFPQRSYVLDIC